MMDHKDDLKTMRILFRAVQSIEQIIKKDVKNYGFTMNEFAAAEALYHKGRISVNEIAQAVLIPNSSMTYVLDRLEVKGLICRLQDTDDKRTFHVELSKSGLAKLDDILPRHYKVLTNLFGILSTEEQALLNDSLKKIGYYAKALEETTE
jgi:MarR family 2-MHQ and catechol resistance regulon transcriptional repressor